LRILATVSIVSDLALSGFFFNFFFGITFLVCLSSGLRMRSSINRPICDSFLSGVKPGAGPKGLILVSNKASKNRSIIVSEMTLTALALQYREFGERKTLSGNFLIFNVVELIAVLLRKYFNISIPWINLATLATSSSLIISKCFLDKAVVRLSQLEKNLKNI